MKVTKFTKKYLKKIKLVDLHQKNCQELKNLRDNSIKKIGDVLKNSTIKTFKKEKLKSYNGNLIVETIKNSDVKKTNSHYRFFQLVKNNMVSVKDIYEYINYNNDEVTYMLNTNFINNDLQNILDQYPKAILSRFVPPEVQNDIMKNLNIKQKYIVKNGTNSLKFSIYSDGKLSNLRLITIFYKALFLLKLYGIENKTFQISLFLSKIKKKIYSKNYLGPREINSGLTSFFGFAEPEICIFREEELEKVLLHELTHATYKDRILTNIDIMEDIVKCSFNVNKNNKINFFEAYTESCALICNMIYNSIITGIPISEIYNNELRFGIYQCSKILNFYDISDFHEYFCETCCFDGNEKYIEKTSVLSYFFLKLGCIFDINVFIAKFFKEKEQISSKLLFEHIKKNIKKISEFFIHNSIKLNNNNLSLRMTLYSFIWEYKSLYNQT